MSHKYILDGHTPVPCEDLITWAQWFETAARIVDVSVAGEGGYIQISTVFLGVDYNLRRDGPPLLFETMIFGGEHDGYQERCATWKQAKAMHKKAVQIARKDLPRSEPSERARADVPRARR